MLLLQLPSQLPDLRVDSSRESDLGLLSSFRALPSPHVLILDIFSVILDFLDDMVIHGVERSLEGYVS